MNTAFPEKPKKSRGKGFEKHEKDSSCIFYFIANDCVYTGFKSDKRNHRWHINHFAYSDRKTSVTNLTITGTIDAVDFQTMRDQMSSIAELDICAVNIAAYNDIWYPSAANEIPESAFSFFDITKKYSNLKTVCLPVTVTSIGRNAFNSCTGLTTVNIPASVTNISDGAFWGCTALNSITINAQIPPAFRLYEIGFDGVNKTTCKLYVPAGSLNAYKAADQWKEFVNIMGLTTDVSPAESKTATIEYKNKCLRVLNVAENDLFEVFDVSGRRVSVVSVLNESNPVDIQMLEAGIYVIKLVKSDKSLKILIP